MLLQKHKPSWTGCLIWLEIQRKHEPKEVVEKGHKSMSQKCTQDNTQELCKPSKEVLLLSPQLHKQNEQLSTFSSPPYLNKDWS